MSEQSERRTTGRFGRRRVLGGIGASGLAAAVAVFGKGSPAFAGNWYCCNLIFHPPNMSMSACQSSHGENESWYTWTCARSASLDCACCEHKRYGSTVGSAGTCYHA